MTKTFSSSQAELTAGTPSLCTHSWRFFLGALPTAPLLSFSLLHTIEILHRIPNRGQCKVVILLGHIGEWSPSGWCSTAAAIGAYWEVNNLLKRVIREYFRPIGPEVKATSLTQWGLRAGIQTPPQTAFELWKSHWMAHTWEGLQKLADSQHELIPTHCKHEQIWRKISPVRPVRLLLHREKGKTKEGQWGWWKKEFCVGSDKKETLTFEENLDKLNFRGGKYGFNTSGVLSASWRGRGLWWGGCRSRHVLEQTQSQTAGSTPTLTSLLHAMIKRLSDTNEVLMHHFLFTLTHVRHLGQLSFVDHIPRLLLQWSALPDSEQLSLDPGVNYHLFKPFSTDFTWSFRGSSHSSLTVESDVWN